MTVFDDLRANLIELKHAGDFQRDLVPSPNKKRIFHKSYGWGRFYNLFLPKEKRSAGLNAALENVRQVFWQKIKQLEKAQTVYFEQSSKKIKGKPYLANELQVAEQSILSFCLHFKPLVKDLLKERTPSYLEFLCKADTRDRLLHLFVRLRFCQRIKDFEEVTGVEIPLHELLNLSLDKELKVKEEAKVRTWLVKVSEAAHRRVASFQGPVENSYVKVRFVHRLLDEIVNYFNVYLRGDDEETADLTVLEAMLMQFGCRIFEAPDFKQLAWRNRLTQGQVITIHDRDYQLGEILQNSERVQGKPVVFAVEGDPAIQIEIYHNEAWNFIKLFEESVLHCGIIRQKLIAIEKHGSLFVRERLYQSLSLLEWQTTGPKVGETDSPTAQPILELLQGLIEMPFTPYPLSRELFCFNHVGEMRASELLVPGPKSFEAIEGFAYECSFGTDQKCNAAVFRYFMAETGLGTMQEAKMYQELVALALEDEDKEASVNRNQTITDPAILANRMRLYDEICDIKSACIEEIHMNYDVQSDRNFEKELKNAIVEAHLKYCPGSILVPDFYQKALALALRRTEPKLKDELLQPLKERIIAEIIQGKNWKGPDLYRAVGIFNHQQMNQIYKEGKRIVEAQIKQKEQRKKSSTSHESSWNPHNSKIRKSSFV